MIYTDFLQQVINRGIEAAKTSYKQPHSKNKLEGSIAGFQACKGKSASELIEVYREIGDYTSTFFNSCSIVDTREHAERYWWFRCYQLEVEWVCNVVSVFLIKAGGKALLPGIPTARGMQQAINILGEYYKSGDFETNF